MDINFVRSSFTKKIENFHTRGGKEFMGFFSIAFHSMQLGTQKHSEVFPGVRHV